MIKLLLGYFGWILIIINSVVSKYKKKTAGVYPLILHDIPECDRSRFEFLLDMLLDEYTFITPDNFVSYLNGDYYPKENQLLLTFDDGYYSNYIVAKDILKSRNIKAIFFLSTGFIDLIEKNEIKNYIHKNFFNKQLPPDLDIDEMTPMNWDNILELIELGHTIGAHTINHVNLSSLVDNDQLEEEIILAGEQIEERIGIRVDHFAFPFGNIGSMNAQAMRIATKKYKYIYSGIRGKNDTNTNHWAIRRDAINILDEVQYNAFIASGGLGFYYWKDRFQLDKIASNV